MKLLIKLSASKYNSESIFNMIQNTVIIPCLVILWNWIYHKYNNVPKDKN